MNQPLILLVLIVSAPCAENCQKYLWNFSAKHTAALILARGGSKGIPLKNLAKISNQSLLQLSLAQLEKVPFDSIWISTDHLSIAIEGQKFNVHWRSHESATDSASSLLGVLDFLAQHKEIDTLALIQCTSPFLRAQYLARALHLMRNGAECVFSVFRSFKLRWAENGDGFLVPLNFDAANRPRRQDWNGELVETGMFYVVRRDLVEKMKMLQTNRCKYVEIPRKHSWEIDSEYDLNVARLIYNITTL